MKRILSLLMFALVLFSCAPPKPDVASVRKAIEAMNAKSSKEMLMGVWDTTLANFTDDAVSMPNFGPMSKGKKAIKEQYGKMMGSGMKFTKVEFTTADVQVSGDYAYEIGTYTMSFEMPSMPPMTDEGKYLTVYEHAKDGSWKTKVETWNTNKPPEMPKTVPVE
jgi:ketosteroid isomerase-like protein